MAGSRNLTVLYGSETGTAYDFAERLSRDGQRRHFTCKVNSLDSYPINCLPNETLAIFVVSTAGQGDTPTNMKKFWKLIMRRNLPSTSLSSLRFAVVGLGDSSYLRYNVVSKKLYKRLIQLGATPIIPLALGDDQHELGPDAMLDPCVQALWKNILEFSPIPPSLTQIPDDRILPSKYTVQIQPPDSCKILTSTAVQQNNSHENDFHFVKLISNERVTAPDHFQDVRLLSFDISDTGISYVPGDVLVIRPENSQENVDLFIEYMNLNPLDTVVIQPNNSDTQLPPELSSPRTVKDLVTKYFDIASIPRRFFFEILAFFAEDEMEKERLVELSSLEGLDDRFDYCNKVRRSILEVLHDFSDVRLRVPFDYYFDLIPQIQPRSFSIASSPLKHQHVLQLIVAVVKYKTKIKKPRLGLCSNWLAHLDPSSNEITLPVQIRSGTMDFTLALKSPVICIGPGTGIAPLRSLLHDRVINGVHTNTLFFGCRGAEKDFYFEKEWKDLTNKQMLDLHTAFSRDQDDKVYVQHVLANQKDKLWQLINDNKAFIFLAGSATRMPKDVREAIRNSIQDGGHFTEEEAEDYLTDMEKHNRYQTETWS